MRQLDAGRAALPGVDLFEQWPYPNRHARGTDVQVPCASLSDRVVGDRSEHDVDGGRGCPVSRQQRMAPSELLRRDPIQVDRDAAARLCLHHFLAKSLKPADAYNPA